MLMLPAPLLPSPSRQAINWIAEPFTGGAFSSYLPPGVWTVFGEALTAPVGRIHWCVDCTRLRACWAAAAA